MDDAREHAKWTRQDSNLEPTDYESGVPPGQRAQRQQIRQQSTPYDPVLERLVATWAQLPEPIRGAITALVNAAERA